MDNYKIVVDILASTASFIAIIMVIIAWITEKKKALKIIDMTIIKSTGKVSFNLYLKNRKNYPVTINHVLCHTKKIYTVNIMVGGRPKIKRNSFKDTAFSYNTEKVIEAKGYGSLEIENNNNSYEDVFVDSSEKILLALSKKMYLHFDTSHGMFNVTYKTPRVIKSSSEIHIVESSFETTNRFAAEFMFFYKKFFT